MTAQIIRFPRTHIRTSVDKPEPITINRDLKATIDSMDADIEEVRKRNRRIRRLMALGATAKAQLERERYRKQMKALRDLFNGHYA